MSGLALHYYILATLVCAGILQVAAAHSRLFGLLLIPHVPSAYALGLLLIGSSLAWFVLIGDAGIPGDRGGVEGSEQFVLFLVGAATAAGLTVVLASLTPRRPVREAPPLGIEAFRTATLLQALLWRLRGLLRRQPRSAGDGGKG